MERFAVALIAVLVVLAGCASPRVLSSDDAAPTQALSMNPFEYEFAEPLRVTPVSDELGAPPLPMAPEAPALLAMPDEPPAPPTAPPIPEELQPVEAPMGPDTAPVQDFDPTDAVEVVPPDPCAPRIVKGCCGKCQQRSAATCRKCPCPDPCGNPCGGYVGIGFAGGPGLGFVTEFGINIKRTDRALWSVEAAMMYQDFYDNLEGGDLNEAGKMNMFRAGMRWRFQPCCRWHVTARAGLGWMHAGNDGVPSLELANIDARGDYIGAYVGIGLEFDIGARWSTGPELAYYYGWEAGGNGNTASVPSLIWHLNYKF